MEKETNIKTEILKKVMTLDNACGVSRFDHLDSQEIEMILKAMEDYLQYMTESVKPKEELAEGSVWLSTNHLRWKKKPKKVLEQKWISDTGEEKWEKIGSV